MQRGKGERVRRWTLKDGTLREKAYPRKPAKRRKTAPPDTVKGCLQDWKMSPAFTKKARRTQKLYENAISYLEPSHGFRISDLRRRHLMAIVDALHDRPGTCRTFITGVQAWLTWCVQRERIEVHPFRDVERPALGKWKAWSPSDLEAVWNAAPEPIRRAMMLALYTGQRQADVLKLRWDQYDGKAIRLTQGKTKTPVTIPAHRELRACLDGWKPNARTLTILEAPWGRPWVQSSWQTYWDRWKTENGVDHLTWHGLRSNALHALLEAGCTTWEAAAITGHKSIRQVEDYARDLAREGLAASAILRLESKGQNRPEPIGREG